MNPTVTFGDIKQQAMDFVQNYNTSTIDLGNVDRACNRAIEYVQRRLGLPSDKQIQSFYFYEDTKFYDCDDGFNELLQLYYNTSSLVDSDHNIPRNRWGVMKDIEILRSTGQYQSENRVAFTTANGRNQMLLDGHNIYGSVVIQPFDNTTGLLYSSDIVNVEADPYIKRQGSASIKFDIDTGLSASYFYWTANADISSLMNLNAAYRLYVFFPPSSAAKFTNLEIRFQTSAGNYYSATTTTQSDGTAWVNNDWNLLSWDLADLITTGSPDAQNIQEIYIYMNHSGSFSAVTNMRFDYLYQVVPDYMNALYYSSVKGTNAAGDEDKVILDDDGDILSFGSYAPDLILPIAIKAALYLAPQLIMDANFQVLYKDEFENVMKLMGRTYPRARTVNSGQTQILR